MTAEKKKKIIDTIYEVLNALDKSKINGNHYRDKFNRMSLNEFDGWMSDFLNDPKKNFFIECMPYRNEPNLTDVKDALKKLKVPVEEYIYYRHDGNKGNPVRTSTPVLTGYLYIKKAQQILSKKNSYTFDIDKRNMKTGQATGDSKVARVTDVETYGLIVYDTPNISAELLGPRSDDFIGKHQMLNDIHNYGQTYLKKLDSGLESSQTINTIDVYFLGSGLKTNLLSPVDTFLTNLK